MALKNSGAVRNARHEAVEKAVGHAPALILEDYVVSGLTLFMPLRKQCEAYRRKKARTA